MFSGQGIGGTVNRYTIIYKGDAKAINSNDTDPIGGYTQSNTAVSSVTDAIKTPNTYYYYRDANTGNNWTWYYWSGGDISLWSDYGTNKSIYDPCPYGYRVPSNGSWNSWSSTTAWTPNAIDGGATWSSTWWPAAGRRVYSSGSLNTVGGYGWYWSSTRHPSAHYSYYLYLDYSGGVNSSYYGGRSYAFSVRCVQERGALRVGHGTGDLGVLVCCLCVTTRRTQVGRALDASEYGPHRGGATLITPLAFASKRL